jgi:hypothetical protein
MTHGSNLPWASGPGEILRHGLSLLKKDSDTNRRLAMISIANAVELMIKTYLGLPKRITGRTITRKEFLGISENFPALIDGLEQHAPDKLDGIDLGTIEWYHRLRNELYHQGNGLTVERDKIEIYAELANRLFKNLYGEELLPHATPETELLGEFLGAWTLLERGLRETASRNSLTGETRSRVLHNMRFLEGASILDKAQIAELNHIRQVRNEIVHGQVDFKQVLTKDLIERVKHYAFLFGAEET